MDGDKTVLRLIYAGVILIVVGAYGAIIVWGGGRQS